MLSVDICLGVSVHVVMIVDRVARSKIAQSLRSIVVEVVVIVRQQVGEFPVRILERMVILQGDGDILVGQMVKRIIESCARVDV